MAKFKSYQQFNENKADLFRSAHAAIDPEELIPLEAFLWIGISGLWAAPPAWPFLVLEVGFNAAASSMFTYLNGIS
jgi:hypothetical protein